MKDQIDELIRRFAAAVRPTSKRSFFISCCSFSCELRGVGAAFNGPGRTTAACPGQRTAARPEPGSSGPPEDHDFGSERWVANRGSACSGHEQSPSEPARSAIPPRPLRRVGSASSRQLARCRVTRPTSTLIHAAGQTRPYSLKLDDIATPGPRPRRVRHLGRVGIHIGSPEDGLH
jgi:hypothetical protein